MASPAAFVPDTRLGLSAEEIQLLRRQQQIAFSQAGSTSSRAASNASSQGRLLLDANSLRDLNYHFDRLLAAIEQRVQVLHEQSQMVVQVQIENTEKAIETTDQEIARFKHILRQIDLLELEFEKVKHIRDIVRTFRSRVEGLDRRLR